MASRKLDKIGCTSPNRGPLLPDLHVEPTVQQMLAGLAAAVDVVLGM
ncbi:MAG: hypothetical protein VB025_06130 [Sphaerochaeta sp.]|nr:hypothetical protein [Sphaerochaeta sp.]